MSFSLKEIAPKVFVWQRANHLIYLVRNVVLARFILPGPFGDFAIALNLASYIAIFGTLEFRTGFFTTKELTPEQIRAQWSAEVALAVVTFLFGLALSPWLLTTRSPAVVIAILCLLAVSIVEAAFSTRLYLLEKDLQFPFLMKVYTAVNGVSFVACLALAMMGWGIGALVADRCVAAAIKWVVFRRRSEWRARFELKKEHLMHYWNSVSVLFLTGLLGKVLFGFDIYAIGKWIGSESSGLYSMAMKWALIPMELGAGFLAIMALSLYSKQVHDSPEKFRASYTEVTFHITRFCLGIAVLMTIFMKDFFAILYLGAWQGVPVIFAALVPYAIFRPLYQNVCQALQARKVLWPIFWVMLMQAVLAVASIAWAVPRGPVFVALAAGGALAFGHLTLEILLHRDARQPLLFLFGAPTMLAVTTLAAAWCVVPLEGLGGFGARIALGVAYLAIAAGEWWVGRKRLAVPA